VSLFSTARPPPPSRPFLYTTLFRSPDCAPRDRPGAETARAVLRHRTPMGTVLGVGRVVGPRPVGRRCCANEREAARTPRVGVSGPPHVRSRKGSELRPGLREDAADDLLHLVEFALAHRQRRRELDDRVSAIIGTAVQAAFVHLRGHEVLEDPLGLLLGERLLGVLVLDEFDSVEETLTTDVTDDRQVLELLE